MKIFGIDTTRKRGKVFLIDSSLKRKNYVLSFDENVKHSEGMYLYIEKALLENKMELGDVDVFACVVGPGSFTGIRVGMSTIKGFDKALQRGVVAINTFDLLLSEVKNGLIVLNSTATSCYYAKVERGKIAGTGVVAKSELSVLADGKEIVVLAEEQSVIDVAYNNIRTIDNLDELYGKCVLQKIDTMQYGEFLPYYLQLSQAERNLKDAKD